MKTDKKPPAETDLRFLAIPRESSSRLIDLIRTARAEMAPRNFAERHLVDELAVSKWRALRTLGMEKAVYTHHDADYEQEPLMPESADDQSPPSLELDEYIFHVAMAHSPDHHAVVLAALSRLEVRFHRQFCSALRLLMAMRRLNLFNPSQSSITPDTPETNPGVRKDPAPCNPSPSPA